MIGIILLFGTGIVATSREDTAPSFPSAAANGADRKPVVFTKILKE
jgi:hypothetical protein